MELLSVTINDGVKKHADIEKKDISSDDKSNYKIVYHGDMVYNSMRMWQGANGISDYDGIVSPAYTVLKSKGNIHNQYIGFLFKNTELINKFRKNSQGLTSDTWNLKYPQIASIKINLPSLSEQQKIADFLSLIDRRIEKQRQLVESLKKYKRGLSSKIFGSISEDKKIPLSKLISLGYIRLYRGNIIPKYTKNKKRIYPVYSSSTHNNGLMGYFENYMFDREAITWSIDGGGNFFYRKKHKFNVTNVCGIIELNTQIYNYKYIAESLIYQHIKKHFDYLSKAHPSVIMDMYYIPKIDINEQEKFAKIFSLIDDVIYSAEREGKCLFEYKKGLLQQMFI